MIVMPRTLGSQRLRLRAPTVADAPAILAFAGDREVTRYLDWPTHDDLDDSLAFVDDVAWGWESGDDYCWVIERLGRAEADTAVVGTVACQFDEHGGEIGFVLARAHWGLGLATEAAAMVLDAAREIDDVYRFWASCDVDNIACLHVLENLGMAREGVLRRWSDRPNHPAAGAPRDVIIYAWVR